MTARRSDSRVGLVSPLPPQVGGVAVVAQWLLDHEQQIGCCYERFDLKRPAAAQAGGRLSFRAVLRQATILTAFVRWLPRSPRVLHYMVAYTPTGVTRDAALFVVARLFGRRTIAHVQLPSGHLIDEPTSSVRLSALRVVARLAERTIAISPRAAAALEERGIAAEWVFNPISLEPQTDPVRSPRTFLEILFVGTYGHRKGCNVLVEALADERARGIDARLQIVGKEEYDGEDEALRQTIAAAGVTTAVDFLGVAGPERLREVYSSADVFCLPSYQEGLPLALLEAMAFGLPVVATPVGGIPDVVDGNSGLLVEPGDPRALADAIARLADGELRMQIGSTARDHIRELCDPAVLASRWHEIYARSLPDRAAPTRRTG